VTPEDAQKVHEDLMQRGSQRCAEIAAHLESIGAEPIHTAIAISQGLGLIIASLKLDFEGAITEAKHIAQTTHDFLRSKEEEIVSEAKKVI
jgi:hypothetical protein